MPHRTNQERVRKVLTLILMVAAFLNVLKLLVEFVFVGSSYLFPIGVLFFIFCFPYIILLILHLSFRKWLAFIKKFSIYYTIFAFCLGSFLFGGLRSLSLLVLIIIPFLSFALEDNVLHTSLAIHGGFFIFVAFWFIPGGDDFIRRIAISPLDSPMMNFLTPSIGYVIFYVTLSFVTSLCTYYFSLEFNRYRNIIELKNKELLLLNEEKTLFFMNLSHDIKTPVSIIKNYSEQIIQDYGENEKTLILKHNARRLSRDILNYMHIEKMTMTGKPLYEHKEVSNLSSLLKEIIKLYPGQNLKPEIADQVYCHINGEAFEKAVHNLISNALKYNEKSVVVSVTLKKEEQEENEQEENKEQKIVLTIADNGIGIPRDKQKHLFEPFYQVSHKKQNIQGVGLGLSIVKAVVDSVPGTLEVKSEPGCGAQFTITLDSCTVSLSDTVRNSLESSEPTEPVSHAVFEETPYRADLDTILLVEDTPDMLIFLIDSFKDEYNVYAARNGQEALEKLDSIYPYYLPKVIISDIMMDVMDGHRLFESLQNDSRFGYIPFIFLTARTDGMEKVQKLEEGAVDYMTKPFNIKELKAKVKSHIASREKLLDDFDSLKDWEEDFKTVCNEHNLTPKEREIINLWIIKDLTQQVIADQIGLTRRSVERNIRSIKKKIGIDPASRDKSALKELFKHLL